MTYASAYPLSPHLVQLQWMDGMKYGNRCVADELRYAALTCCLHHTLTSLLPHSNGICQEERILLRHLVKRYSGDEKCTIVENASPWYALLTRVDAVMTSIRRDWENDRRCTNKIALALDVNRNTTRLMLAKKAIGICVYLRTHVGIQLPQLRADTGSTWERLEESELCMRALALWITTTQPHSTSASIMTSETDKDMYTLCAGNTLGVDLLPPPVERLLSKADRFRSIGRFQAAALLYHQAASSQGAVLDTETTSFLNSVSLYGPDATVVLERDVAVAMTTLRLSDPTCPLMRKGTNPLLEYNFNLS